MTTLNNHLSLFKFYIQPSVIDNMYNLLIDGNKDLFTENGAQFQGAERGGHFCYKKNNDTLSVEIIGFIQAGLMPGTTSLNSGDFPFTFHTHPIVIKLGNTVNKHKIDNFPNLISDEDLIGSIEDNFYYNYKSNRNICMKSKSQETGGINFFDIVAVPYGLFVYRPARDATLPRDINIIENECRNIVNTSVGLLPKYTVKQSERYFDIKPNKTVTGIQNYLNLLQGSGFTINFFTWADAKTNGIRFVNELPIQSSIDDICKC